MLCDAPDHTAISLYHRLGVSLFDNSISKPSTHQTMGWLHRVYGHLLQPDIVFIDGNPRLLLG